jgi:ssRNA-specific RNase YbeY (16S rRNA maturation enzyme)
MARTPYKKIKDDVLGKDYELSLAFISPAAMRRAMKYKKQLPKKTSNVLSFPLSKTSGEILICKEAAAPYTPDYLFIHGLCHLKGYKHGATMENIERLYLKKWGINAHEQNNSRHRHRNVPR